MKQPNSTQKLVQLAVIVAITVAVSLLFQIPIPGTTGVITLIDIGIYLTAYLFGPVAGFVVGALSGLLFDFFSGYTSWILISIVAHGLQGFLFGYLIKNNDHQKRFIFASVVAGLVMVVCYFVGEVILYHNVQAALAQIPFNIVQVSVASIVILQLHLFKRFKAKRAV